MGILLAVVLLFALLSGLLAAGQAVAITRLAPTGSQDWREWLFGWWRFDRITRRAGLSGEEQAAIYKRAVIACVIFVIIGLILSGLVANQRPAAPETTGAAPINDWRVLPAHHLEANEIRRVASVPGKTILES
jgi:hypothetical protein